MVGILGSSHPFTCLSFTNCNNFRLDKDATPERLVFNRTVTLKDAWVKETKKEG